MIIYATKLNFSIQQNNTDVYDVFAVLTIKEKNPDRVVAKILIDRSYRTNSCYKNAKITFTSLFIYLINTCCCCYYCC